MSIRTERYQLPGESFLAYRKRMRALDKGLTSYSTSSEESPSSDFGASLLMAEVATSMFDSSSSIDTSSSSSDFSGCGGDFGGGGSDGSF